MKHLGTMMKTDPEYAEELAWYEKRRLETAATRTRIAVALKHGCREFEHKDRPWVAIVTPAQDSTDEQPKARVTRFDDDGPYGHSYITGGECETARGRDLIAYRLWQDGFTNARIGALEETYNP